MPISVGNIIYIAPSEYLEHCCRLNHRRPDRLLPPYERLALRATRPLDKAIAGLLAKLTDIRPEQWYKLDAVYQQGKELAHAIDRKNHAPFN